MRLLIDSLILLMLVAVGAGVVMLNHDRKQAEREVADVQNALDRLQEQAAYHTAVQSAMAGHETLLVHLHEGWFGSDIPTNALLDAEGRPWIDLAPPGDVGLHPPDPVATRSDQAEFWYNPTTGVFRARVAAQSSEAQTLELYNRVNGTLLDGFEQIPDPSRAPIAHALDTTPARHYASMANLTWTEPEPKPEEVDAAFFEPLIAQQEALRAERERQAQAERRAAEQPQAEAQARAQGQTDRPTLADTPAQADAQGDAQADADPANEADPATEPATDSPPSQAGVDSVRPTLD